jgi:IPT/TIG domain./Beta-propeller repeat.
MLGGVSEDIATALSVDSSGSAVVAGYTKSLNFPTVGATQTVNKGGLNGYDGFIYKLNAAGSDLVFSTYYGGSNDDFLFGAATDLQGNIYVTGLTSSADYPVSPNAFQRTLKGSSNVTVVKLNSVGSSAAYSTYVGGQGDDSGTAIAVDSAGNAYVTGAATSPNFPITPGAFQTIQKASTTSAFDAFAFKLNATGQALIYSTFLNGTGDDHGNALAVDASGNLYVAGRTTSANFPTTPGAFQPIYSGTEDGFILKLNATGTAPVYSTFIGGNGLDVISAIKLDNAGQIYFAGATTSSNFPLASPLQPGPGGGVDGYFGELNASGSALLLSTYFGSRGNDEISGIAVDAAGNVIVAGNTDSKDLATLPTSSQRNYGGGARDSFVVKFDFSVPKASLTIAPVKLDFAGVAGGGSSTQTFAITADDPGVAWTIDLSSAGWLSASPLSGSGSGTITISGNPGSLAIGTYNGTVTVVTKATGARTSLPVTLTLTNAGGGLVPPGAVVNAASFQQGPVSPGEIITVFGSNLGPDQIALLQLTPTGSVATSLADVRVLFDGIPAPLIYVSAGQLSAIVPYRVAAKTTTQMQVEYKGIRLESERACGGGQRSRALHSQFLGYRSRRDSQPGHEPEYAGQSGRQELRRGVIRDR